jgi:alpha-mannosidase
MCAGITGGYGGDRRVEYIIPREACERGQHDFVIESSCNGMFGVPIAGDIVAPPSVRDAFQPLGNRVSLSLQMTKYFELASADLVVPNQDAWRLLLDFTTLQEIVDTLPGNTSVQNKALVVANEIMNVFQKGDAADIKHARDLAAQFFGAGWEAKGADIYKEGAPKPQIWGIG